MTELELLIAEQAKDMKNGHRVWSKSVDEFPSGADVIHTPRRRRKLAHDPGHGTKLHYYTVLGCRCEKCKALSRETKRKWRAKFKKPPRPYKYVLTCTCCGGTDVKRKRVYV